MTNIAAMIKQAQDVQNKINVLQERLGGEETVGQSGGGVVQVTLSGKAECRRVKIDPSLIAAGDVAMLEDLIVAAHNDAKARVEQQLSAEMAKITGGLKLPPGFKLPF
jgi:hypothetical protein